MLKLTANAKINLSLDVLGKRNDNYHFVRMVMQEIDLNDTVTLTTTETKKIEISSNILIDCPNNKNSTYIAAMEFFKYTCITNPGLNISIKKNIPICAGLAGGSSDAGAVILGLNKIFETKLSEKELLTIGEKVGSDVPFCMLGGTMLAKGTGTHLTRLPDIPDCSIVIATPDGAKVSTKEAYNNIDHLPTCIDTKQDNLLAAIKNHDIFDISKNLYNKFEQTVNIFGIEKIKNIMKQCETLGSLMTGSGPTVFGIFDSLLKATECTNKLKKLYKRVYLTKPVKSIL